MTRRAAPLTVVLFSLLVATVAIAQTDPGVRGGAAGAGGPLPSVANNNPITILDFFNDGKDEFGEIESVRGTIVGEGDAGLGPRYNSRSCGSCHAHPAVGGSSPFTNPQVADATADGANNTVPSFIRIDGPVREARFPFFFDSNGNPNTNNPNGGVENLYTIVGRVDNDNVNCNANNLRQPGFAQAQATNNIIFRIPTPTFGAGLIENISEEALLNNASNNGNNNLGIRGTFNRNGNDGTITRFGWKAQNKSLEIFAGEAYNVEQGVTNELFPQERSLPGEGRGDGMPSACRAPGGTPEDRVQFNTTALNTVSDTVKFAMFMRLLAQPTPSATVPGGAASISNGKSLFTSVGCNVCHTPSMNTFRSSFTPSLNGAAAHLFSDLEIHHMGSGLNDNVSQGEAGGDQFRTAPLWGVGQRIFFLHDGRTSNILTAIRAHSSNGSEANTVISNFNLLTPSQQQDILNFLRSL